MKVSHSYYEDEVRDGFYISGMMKRAWAASAEVLEVIMAICKKHNIQFFAYAGTLLGAIRHKGFIPWDDDLDICMVREEYDRFLQVVQQELPERYALLSIDTEPEYEQMFARIVNRKRVSFSENDLERFHNFPFAVGVDIFPLDYIAPNEEDEKVRRELATVVHDVAGNIETYSDGEEREQIIRQIEMCCGVKLDRKGDIKNQLMHLLEKLITMYRADESTELAFMSVWIRKDSNKFKKEYFNQAIEVEFETIKIPVPAMYDVVLQKMYGDYMKLVHNWDFHDYPFYKGQMEEIAKQSQIEYPKYQVTLAEVPAAKQKEKLSVKKKALEITALLQEAHEAIQNAFVVGDAETLFELLEVCQNGAVSVGNFIEESIGEGIVTIGILEEYCEYIYHIYEAVMQGKEISPEAICEELFMHLNRIETSIKEDIIIRKEIVFLPHKAASWDYIESVWQAAMEDEKCDVYVVPIPYFEKDAFGNLGEMHYELEQFPEYVNVTSYNEYDVTKRQPDKIFIQSPYDGYNPSISVHPAYYAEKLKHYTSELVYIPPFVMDEIDPRDGRAVASMDHFVKMPGVVHADKVIVQSESMRQSYINALVEFVGEESRPIWEEKILGLGSPINDKKQRGGKEYLEFPQEWRKVIQKEDGSFKKIILYGLNNSTLIQSQEQCLEKLKNVFATFEQNKEDVALLCRPHPQMKMSVEAAYPKLWSEYQKIVEEYKMNDWGIYDDTADANLAIELCDAYYGDTGDIAQKCRMAGKPVMLQDVEIID